MKIKKKYIIWSIILLSVAVIIFAVVKKDKNKITYLTEEVKKGILTQTVSTTGTLTSNNNINLNFEITGRIKEIGVTVGDEVIDGEIIANVDQEILNREVEKARLAVEKAKADAHSNDDLIREAKQDVKNSKNYLEDTEDLEKQKVSAAEEAHDSAKNYYNEVENYYNTIVAASGEASVEALGTKLTLITAYNQKEAAEENLETVKKMRELTITSAENALKSAEERLKTIKSDEGAISRDVMVKTAQANYEIALASLEKSNLTAPVSGTITKLNYKKGEIIGTSSLGTPFGELISKDFILETDIPESDIAKIKLGQEAEITFDALPLDDKFRATVIELEPAATVIQDVVYYKAKLKLNSFDIRLKEGMSADIDILTDQKGNVLYIPERAIQRDGEIKKVKLLEGDEKNQTIRIVHVKTGIEGDEGTIEVIGNLKPGEKVVTLEEE
jgi:HlyD family secretion protein